jgi:selenocysteine lyase/cysteine desulfurase
MSMPAPYLGDLGRRMIYLNHAGTSWPKPPSVGRAMQRMLASGPDTWGNQFEDDRATVARCLGIHTPDSLLITPSCTAALDIAVASVPLQAGDRILTTSMEHHALDRAVRLAARQRGVSVEPIPCGSAGALLDLDALAKALSEGHVRLVAMTMASNVTGALLPTQQVVNLARSHGALVLLDGAQVAGKQPLGVSQLGADMWAFAGHKGPQGPHGVGGLYVAPDATLMACGAACSIDELQAPRPGFCDAGSVNQAGLAGLASGLSWLAERSVGAHTDRLMDRLLAGLHHMGAQVFGPPLGVRRAPVVSIRTLAESPTELGARLRERQIVAGAGLHCAPAAHAALGTAHTGTLRLSVGPQTTLADVEAVLQALV